MTFGSRRNGPFVFVFSFVRAAVMGLGAGHVSRITEPSARNAAETVARKKKSRARHTYLAARTANARTAAETRDRTRTGTFFESAAFDRAAASNVSNADSIDSVVWRHVVWRHSRRAARDSTVGSTLAIDGFGVASGTTAAAFASTDPSFGFSEKSFVFASAASRRSRRSLSSSRFRTNASRSFAASYAREGPPNAGKGEGVSGGDADASVFEDVGVDVSRGEKRARGVSGVIESRLSLDGRDASLDV